jgi:uncharacterized protein (DUF1499 family)
VLLAVIKWMVIAILAAAILLLLAGQLGLLRGSAPTDLGVKDGKLKAPSRTDNSVSSQAGLHPDHPMRVAAAVAPIKFSGEGAAALARLRRVVESMDGAKSVRAEPLYLHVEFTSRWFKFVDDVEFFVDEKDSVIHVRAAARLGQKDLGVNRARVEAIRARFGDQ